MEEGVAQLARAEAAVFEPLLSGLQSLPGVTVWGPPTMEGRTPTVAFTVDGHRPSDVAAALATERIAVWAGHSYAVEVVGQLGLGDEGVVRAGVVRYVEPDDVRALLDAVTRLTA
jgi:selenocysteine lyase/cysteine desulfurase